MAAALPAAGPAAGAPSIGTSCGATGAPGRTRCRPSTITRSPALRPEVTTRSSPTVAVGGVVPRARRLGMTTGSTCSRCHRAARRMCAFGRLQPGSGCSRPSCLWAKRKKPGSFRNFACERREKRRGEEIEFAAGKKAADFFFVQTFHRSARVGTAQVVPQYMSARFEDAQHLLCNLLFTADLATRIICIPLTH